FSDQFDSPCALTTDAGRDTLLLVDDNQVWRLPLAGGPAVSLHSFDPPLSCSLTSNIGAAMPDPNTLWVPNRAENGFHVVDLASGAASWVPFDDRVGWLNDQVHAVPDQPWVLASIQFPVGLAAVDPVTGESVVFSR
ncbi:MAG: hypothetical protein K0V04_36485, partial [Deltaproteobacteria bacterium]|nr:hypothetical protein [Deltaproteobacteria bacterium]